MRRWLVAVAMVPAMMLMSCATIISGPNEDIRVTSTPSDARAILRCPLQVQDGVTPLNVSIPRRTGDCHLTVSKEGYAEQTLLVERGVNPAYWLNFFTIPLVLYGVLALSGGFYGSASLSEKQRGTVGLLITPAVWLIDHHTGAAHRHEPAKIDLSLKPNP